MGRILPDRDVRKLIGSVLVNATSEHLNPNGIEFRVGGEVFFQNTGEIRKLHEDQWIVVRPSESIIICSLETVDFSPEAVGRHFANRNLMAWITPTTTMMREGVVQSATKIDAGFQGSLTWGLRNQGIKDLLLGYGEPIFKLTFYLLDPDESPDVSYGEREKDAYQQSTGVVGSRRRVPAHIADSQRIMSGASPEEQLAKADGPFGVIGKQLSEVQGEFKVVHNTIEAVREEFGRTVESLSGKIDEEISELSQKVDEESRHLGKKIDDETRRLSGDIRDEGTRNREWVHSEFRGQAIRVIGALIAAGGLALMGAKAMTVAELSEVQQVWIVGIVSLAVIAVTVFLVARRSGPPDDDVSR